MLQAYAEGLDILRNAQSKDLLEDQAKNAHRGRELGGELQSGSDHA
jgi:6-phosphogluconate dehydrogenase (decarboxylating)